MSSPPVNNTHSDDETNDDNETPERSQIEIASRKLDEVVEIGTSTLKDAQEIGTSSLNKTQEIGTSAWNKTQEIGTSALNKAQEIRTSALKQAQGIRTSTPEKIKEKEETSFETTNESGEDEEKQIELTIAGEGNFLEDKSVKIDIKSDDDDEEGDDTPTLPLNKKKEHKETNDLKEKSKKKVPIYLFPLLRLKLAWTRSSNILEFLLSAVGIVFTTLGWFCCVGGVPLMSLGMLIVGCIYINDCNIQPNIPVYLVVSGAFGTLQHFIAIWTKYIPKESQGRLKVYRAYCKTVDCTINLFLAIWFVLGCIWVYGSHTNVEFKDTFKDEYCNKTLYYFAFWVLNLSFILLSILIVCTLCIILFIVISPKDEAASVQ